MRDRSSFQNKPNVTERLLAIRQLAGADPAGHAHYHRLVTRYQKWVLRAHLDRCREQRLGGGESAWKERKFKPVAIRGGV